MRGTSDDGAAGRYPTPSRVSDEPMARRRICLRRLGSQGPEREEAVGELHVLLLKAARFEIGRRSAGLPHLRGGDLDDLAQQSADDALLAILDKLGEFRGESRFTTWAYKFALLEAAVKLRRRAWQGREVPLEHEAWRRLSDAASAERGAEDSELFAAIREEIERPQRTAGARSWSRSRSTRSRSTSSPSAWAPPAAPSTRLCTTPDASFAPRSPPAGSGPATAKRRNHERFQQEARRPRPASRTGAGAGEPELSCEECFAELDRYVELSVADGEADRQVPGMRAHLHGCPACAEEYRSLREFIDG